MNPRNAFAICLIAGVILFVLLSPRCSRPMPKEDFNLIVDGGAEDVAGSPDGQKMVPPTGWKTTGLFNVVAYGATNGYPDAKAPGPANRGKNFLAGGPNGNVSSATQQVDVSPYARAIDAGALSATLSGWLGGFEGQNDNAAVSAEFEDNSGTKLGTIVIGPVLAADRKSVTCFMVRTAHAPVPPTTRRISLTVNMTRTEGTSNDGYADNLSLTLSARK